MIVNLLFLMVAQWKDCGTRAAGGSQTVGGKYATFTAGFWADGDISGVLI
jgi:hypothetical protein